MTDIPPSKPRLAALEHELGNQKDIEAIRKVQYTNGNFIDKSQYDESRAREGFTD
ncbi:MAG: hypothetical protein Q8R44_19120 [Novosphingobium sp.]|nr:hypothetical protein [Novosphingobium sp.]